MNRCVVCGTQFKPLKQYPERKTCSEECLKIHMRNLVPEAFLENCFKEGNIPFNKGIPQKEWLSEEARKRCSKTHIQYQTNTASPLSKIEGRYLPHNTKVKGTITKRKHIHKKGRFKGKVEYEYFINIDWKGNRKPNNLYRRYLWEYYHQQDIPKGMVVYCPSTNPDDWTEENLRLITRGELVKLNRWGIL